MNITHMCKCTQKYIHTYSTYTHTHTILKKYILIKGMVGGPPELLQYYYTVGQTCKSRRYIPERGKEQNKDENKKR